MRSRQGYQVGAYYKTLSVGRGCAVFYRALFLWGVLIPMGFADDVVPNSPNQTAGSTEGTKRNADGEAWLERFRNDLAFVRLVPRLERKTPFDVVYFVAPTGGLARVISITQGGIIQRMRFSALGTQGGGGRGREWSEVELRRFWVLIKDVPNSQEHARDIGRPLIVRIWQNGVWSTRVYDRARLPRQIGKLLRLIPESHLFGALALELKSNTMQVTRRDAFAGVAVSPVSSKCVWYGSTGEMLVIDAQTPAERVSKRTVSWLRSQSITDCEFSPDGRLLLVTSRNRAGPGRTLSLFNTTSWKKVAEPSLTKKRITFCRFAAEGELVLIGTQDHGVWGFEIESARLTRSLPGIPKTAKWCCLSRDDRRAVVLNRDGSVSLWDRMRNSPVALLEKECVRVGGRFSPDQKRVALVAQYKQRENDDRARPSRLSVWNTATGKLCCELVPYDVASEAILLDVQWTRDSNYVLGRSRTRGFRYFGGIHLWNVNSGRHVANFIGPSSLVGAAGLQRTPRFANNGKKLIAGSTDGKLHTWDFETSLTVIKNAESAVRTRK